MNVELFCDDCMNVLPTLIPGSVDAVITDPPYGINFMRMGGRGTSGWRSLEDFGSSDNDWDNERPPKAVFDMMLTTAKIVVIWGGNYFTDYLFPSMGWLVWDKGQRNFSLADGELAWTNQNKRLRIFSYSRSMMRKENGLHPTQKPVALMKWVTLLLIRLWDQLRQVSHVYRPVESLLGSRKIPAILIQLKSV